MLKYSVKVTEQAEQDVLAARVWENDASVGRREKWDVLLIEALRSLETIPLRCPVIEDVSSEKRQIRCRIFGSGRAVYKLYFEIDDATVRILSCRHAARLAPTFAQ